MALKNSVSLTISEGMVKDIKDRLDVILTEHPIISLPLPSLDSKRVIAEEREPYAERMIDVAKLFPTKIPQDISIAELERDYYETYKPIRTIIKYYEQHISKLKMLSYAAGSDAMQTIDVIYGILDKFAETDIEIRDALQSAKDLLKQKQKVTKPPDNIAPTP